MYRLPFLVQLSVFAHMSLKDKISIAAVSKRSRQFSKFLLRRHSVEIAIKDCLTHKFTMNGEQFSWCLTDFWFGPETCKVLTEIVVPAKDLVLPSKDMVQLYGSWDHMTAKMQEFLFDVFSIRSISVEAEEVKTTSKLLNVIKTCSDKLQNQKKPVVKVSLKLRNITDPSVPPLHCDEATITANLTPDQLIQMAMTCKRVVVIPSFISYFSTDHLKEIIRVWMGGSEIEYMEVPCEQEFFIIHGKVRWEKKEDGEYQKCYEIRQDSGKEALVYHDVGRERVVLTTECRVI